MKEDKIKYIRKLEPGTLIAYNLDERGKIQSGKVIENYVDLVRIEEFGGQIKVIKKEDIVWVKTGKRWPRGIYKKIRGDYSSGEKEDC